MLRSSLRGDLAYHFSSIDKASCKLRGIAGVRNAVCTFVYPHSFYHSLSFRKEKFNLIGRNLSSSSGAHLKYVTPKPEILQSRCLQHWFKNWNDKRKHLLTASTFPHAIGFWPRRRVQLWLEKIGAIEAFSGNMATCWNNIKEQEAIESYKLITGNTVLHPLFQMYGERNPDDCWMGASPDGTIDGNVYGTYSRGVLEIKCPYYRGEKERVFPWKRVPSYYVPQAQGLMEIMDRDWMDLYCWTTRGSSLFRIYRDVEYWTAVKVAISDFWWNNVQPARELYNNSVMDEPLLALREFRPAPRHDLCPYIVCESRRIAIESKLLMREINGILVQDDPD